MGCDLAHVILLIYPPGAGPTRPMALRRRRSGRVSVTNAPSRPSDTESYPPSACGLALPVCQRSPTVSGMPLPAWRQSSRTTSATSQTVRRRSAKYWPTMSKETDRQGPSPATAVFTPVMMPAHLPCDPLVARDALDSPRSIPPPPTVPPSPSAPAPTKPAPQGGRKPSSTPISTVSIVRQTRKRCARIEAMQEPRSSHVPGTRSPHPKDLGTTGHRRGCRGCPIRNEISVADGGGTNRSVLSTHNSIAMATHSAVTVKQAGFPARNRRPAPRFGPHKIYTTGRPDGRFLTPVPDSERPYPSGRTHPRRRWTARGNRE